MAIFDLHVHTVRGSSDSSLTPEQLIEQARLTGLDGVCLTEHSGGWPREDLERTFSDSGITVVRGLEVDTDMGHVLVFGLHAYVNGMHNARDLRRAVDKAGGAMVLAHPFRNLFNKPPYNVNLVFRDPEHYPENAEQAAKHEIFSLVDEIEVANGSNSEHENLFALEVARALGLRGTGGSDVHSTHGLGSCVTLFDTDVSSEADLVEALKARAFRPAQGFHLGELEVFGP